MQTTKHFKGVTLECRKLNFCSYKCSKHYRNRGEKKVEFEKYKYQPGQKKY